MIRIDSHQHFWDLARGDYAWLTPDLTQLYHNYLPEDLTPHLEQHNIHGSLLVQAAPTLNETEFLLQLAEKNTFIKGVIGWVDFDDKQAPTKLAKLAQHHKLKGLRPMIQDIQDPDWMLRDNVQQSFESLIEHQLVFEALVKPQHLKNLQKVVTQHPSLKVVINHGAKPFIAKEEREPWKTDLLAFKDCPQVFCKLSGLVTEAGDPWQTSALKPYMQDLFSIFGDSRMMWGSDWPICNINSQYSEWLAIAEQFVEDNAFSSAKVFGQSAIDFYHLT